MLTTIPSRVVAVRLVIGILAAQAATAAGAAPVQGLGEYQTKAAFLYNLVKFVQWPPSTDGADHLNQLVVGVIGDDFFGDVLDHLVRGKPVQGHRIVVHRLRRDDDLRACHVVFVGAVEAPHMADILRRLRVGGALTVGDTPDFLLEGGLVRFYVENGNVRVQINVAGANQAGLRISAQLLSLAR